MITHSLIQSSPEWHQHRAEHFNASDAPAMLGLSKYKTRSALLRQYATGISDDVIDVATQRLFDEGHRAEALARPLAEAIIGEDLYPCVGSKGKLSASFDGLTMDESICAEHKALNKALREAFANEVIPAMYCAQMEQQLMISGAKKCLFMASEWAGDELVEELHCWYESDQNMRDAIMQGWTQFAIDLENYSEGEYIPAPPKAKPTMDLPAVSLSATGGLRVITNLDLFHEALKHFISNINMEPSNDQDFADCKDAIKKLKAAEDALDAGEAQALAQITSIDEMRRMKKLVFETSRDTRLVVEKMVKERDVLVKRQIVQDATIAFSGLIDTLNKQIGKPYMPTITANFAEVMKSKKTFASMREAVSNELVRVTIEANAISSKICINLNTLRELAKDHAFLFHDAASLVLKPNGDCMDTIKLRIMEHKESEARKEAEMRAKAEADATAKAEREAASKLAQEEARIRAEERARIEAHQQSIDAQRAAQTNAEGDKLAQLRATNAMSYTEAIGETIAGNNALRGKTADATLADRERAGMPQAPAASTSPIRRPSDKELVECVAQQFEVTFGVACDYIMETVSRIQKSP